jgi:phosphatidylglycerol:prolipoprotein diacylglycerol transferase
MFPILMVIGEWKVSSYDVFLLLGAIAGGVLGWRLTRNVGYSQRRILLYFAFVYPAALLAGYLNGALFSTELYWGLQHGKLYITGGIVSYGVVLAVFAVTAAFARRYGDPIIRDLDLAALTLPLMLAFFRIGCLLNGCCYGKETDGFGGVALHPVYGELSRRYPTQLLLIALDLALFTGLWLYRRRNPREGRLAIAFVFWFGLGRLGIDLLRDLPTVFGPFSLHTIVDMIFLAAGAILLWIIKKGDRKKTIRK